MPECHPVAWARWVAPPENHVSQRTPKRILPRMLRAGAFRRPVVAGDSHAPPRGETDRKPGDGDGDQRIGQQPDDKEGLRNCSEPGFPIWVEPGTAQA